MIFNMAGGNSIKEASGTFAHPGTGEIEVSLGFKPLAVFVQKDNTYGRFIGGLICDSKGEMIKYWYSTAEQASAAYTDGMWVGTNSFFFKGSSGSVLGESTKWYAVGI